ncbi:MAG: amidohydrolase family protein [Kordiimonadaceae bacterium]|nr:amidohydrolase family protein [Kordiimonadaceae bacterium]MBO6570266.1 amidohydrolase family protein [Kordiimonadaceae bacterium]MBO6965636.1 amidohydrolase family protein [Kordiimonadaceae bacterium]
MRKFAIGIFIFWSSLAAQANETILLPEAIFDGTSDTLVEGKAVVVNNGRILRIEDKRDTYPSSSQVIDLSGMTLLPGLIDLHSHVLLHPYDETSWNDQVLKESWAERALRAGNHLKASLHAGYTTLRDLGSEGAGYVDVGVRQALEKGVIQGPRLIVAGRAIVATGSYGPKGFAEHVDVPLGAEPADAGDLVRVTRDQIGHGADFIKVYADYRWGPNGEAMPTFSVAEIQTITETARASGRYTVAHATTPESMKRAVLGGVETIEHGSTGDTETFELMKEKGVAWCPTLAAGEAISMYQGWTKGTDPDPKRVSDQKAAFQAAQEVGVTICAGSDVGVFDHGDNAWELELMVEYGMSPIDVLKSATSINADLLHMSDRIGRVKEGYLAEMIAVEGNPLQNIGALKKVKFVLQGETIIKN